MCLAFYNLVPVVFTTGKYHTVHVLALIDHGEVQVGWAKLYHYMYGRPRAGQASCSRYSLASPELDLLVHVLAICIFLSVMVIMMMIMLGHDHGICIFSIDLY